MSYILDALKKSEQERGHGTAPSVQTLHSSALGHHSSKTHLWPYLLLAAVFINLAALLYFIVADSRQDQTVEAVTAEAALTQASPSQTTIGATLAEIPAVTPLSQGAAVDHTVYRPVSIPALQPAPAMSFPTAVSAPVQTNNRPSMVVERDELPADIQQHIPIMEFSAHVYSSNPIHRSIVINGRFMEEGDRLATDLMLSEITPKGAIFDFQGQLFHQSVVSAWN